ncbi:hypothetical protein EDD11_001117, partial [Mortierella claussenii]
DSSEERIWRHKPSQRFNRYRTIDSPPPKDSTAAVGTSGPSSSVTTPRHRPRYSIKERIRGKQYEPPASLKQYKAKQWKKMPEVPPNPTSKKPKKSTPLRDRRPVANMSKVELIRTLAREHPSSTLDIGTVSANVKEALSGGPDLALQVVSCLREAVRLAANTKRRCQGLIAQYIEQLASPGVFQESDR